MGVHRGFTRRCAATQSRRYAIQVDFCANNEVRSLGLTSGEGFRDEAPRYAQVSAKCSADSAVHKARSSYQEFAERQKGRASQTRPFRHMAMQPLGRAPGCWVANVTKSYPKRFARQSTKRIVAIIRERVNFCPARRPPLFSFFRFGLAPLDFAVFAILTARGFNPAMLRIACACDRRC